MDNSNLLVWLARSLFSGPGCLAVILLILGCLLIGKRLVDFARKHISCAKPEWTIPNLPIQASTLPPAEQKIADARTRIAEETRKEALKLAQLLVDAYLAMNFTQLPVELTLPIEEGCPGEIVNEAAALLIQHGWYLSFACQPVTFWVKLCPVTLYPHYFVWDQSPLIPKPRRLG